MRWKNQNLEQLNLKLAEKVAELTNEIKEVRKSSEEQRDVEERRYIQGIGEVEAAIQKADTIFKRLRGEIERHKLKRIWLKLCLKSLEDTLKAHSVPFNSFEDDDMSDLD